MIIYIPKKFLKKSEGYIKEVVTDALKEKYKMKQLNLKGVFAFDEYRKKITHSIVKGEVEKLEKLPMSIV